MSDKKKYIQKTLSPEDVSNEYGLPLGTLANDRWKKQGIPYFKVRRRVFYKREDIEKYLFASPVETIDSCRNGRAKEAD